MKIRTGFGYDVHKLVEGRDLWLGGIKLDYELGLLGHSDADVLIHAICDALLGAANMRDIGYHFPDTSDATLDIDSKILLRKTIELIATKGYRLGNIDATVCAERPKLNPHIPEMQRCLAEVMNTDIDNVSIKATTTERLGFTGRMEGISAYPTVLIDNHSKSCPFAFKRSTFGLPNAPLLHSKRSPFGRQKDYIFFTPTSKHAVSGQKTQKNKIFSCFS